MSNKKRLVLIDGMNAFYRSYAVNPTLNPAGDHIGGYVGFFKTLQKIARNTSPDDIIIAWDGPGGSKKRRSINKNYKDGRKPVKRYNRVYDHTTSPEEEEQNKGWQIAQTIELLNHTPVKQVLFRDIEADDLIAYAVKSDIYSGWQKVIVSNDRDFMQLLDNETVLYRPVKDEIMTRDTVIEQYKIHPDNMTVARAIIGDKSDNLEGVSGVGEKTVIKCFPELSGSSKVYLNDIIDKAKSPPRDLKAYSDIYKKRSQIKENYRIMQLYEPSIRFDASQELEEILLEDEVYFAKNDWRVKQITDGFPMDYDWSTIEVTFRNIVQQARSKDE